MALKGYREFRTSVQTGTDVKGDAPNQLAQTQLIPQIVRRNRNAVRVNRQDMYFYRRRQAGRRCSCWATEQSPDGSCGNCFGSGWVGGYDKFGCQTEIIDVTRPGVRLLNVEPDYDAQTRPVLFGLTDGAVTGYIECDVPVLPSVRMVDHFDVVSAIPALRFSSVTALLQQGPAFVPAQPSVLSRALAGRSMTIRVRLDRQNAATESPKVSHVMLRYRLLERPTVMADIPKRRQSIVLQEFGVSDNFETLNIVLADEPRAVSTEDIFVLAGEGTMWKAIDVTDNRPGGILTGRDVLARVVNSWENYSRIPI